MTSFRLYVVVRRLALVAVAAGLLNAYAFRCAAATPDETKEQSDQRMAWWREAKYGMFIHWGLYAIPAGEWKGKKISGLGEWIMDRGKIPVSEYAPLQKQFNPVQYDAKAWVDLAKRAGMKYIVITSKHHDGFCLFDSKLTDYDVTGSPYGKDLLKPLADACHQAGIKICWYHSIMDWHHPDARGGNFPKYVEHLKGQLKELLTNYGPIGVLWFDGEWIKEWDERQGAELEKYLRGLQPDLIVNNRVGKRKKSPGDFGTPEQTIPATGMPGMDWETCMTLNETWGYRKDDHHWKSSTDVLHKLVDIVSKGGNFLLNVGPTAEGIIPEPSVERLLEAGKWLEANGESIYGTTASPFRKLPWGRATQKPGKLYLHVFEWPKDGKLVVPGLTGDPRRAYLLREPKADLKWTRAGENVELQVSATAPDKDVTVVVLAVEGPVQVVGLTTVQPQGQPLVLKAAMAECHGAAIQYEAKGDNIGFWTNPADYVAWVCRITTPGVYSVELDYACSEAAAGSDFVVEIAGQKLEGKASATGGWTTYRTLKLGNLTLGDDRHTLAVKALNRQGEGVMNVRAVRLTPR